MFAVTKLNCLTYKSYMYFKSEQINMSNIRRDKIYISMSICSSSLNTHWYQYSIKCEG